MIISHFGRVTWTQLKDQRFHRLVPYLQMPNLQVLGSQLMEKNKTFLCNPVWNSKKMSKMYFRPSEICKTFHSILDVLDKDDRVPDL